MKKIINIITASIMVAVFGLSFIFSPTIGYFNFLANGGDEGLASAPTEHVCVWECPECGLCLDKDCQEEICLEKCQGHEKPHECESKCATCGKCLDTTCTKDVCKEKCGDVENMTAYTFEAEDDKIILTMGAEGLPIVYKNGYVGSFGGKNYGCTMTFNVVSPTKTTATLAIYINVRSRARVFSEHIETQINGVKLESPAIVPASSQNKEEWETFVCVTLGCIQLEQGENEIKFIAFSSDLDLGGGNVDKIVIKSTEQLTWKPHECESVCDKCGKCLDAACTETVCAEKCEGHAVEGTAYIFEAEDSNPEGWNTEKMWVITDKQGNPSGDYLGGIGAFTGDYYIMYEIYAEEACEATLIYCIGAGKTFSVSAALPTTINGATIATGTQITNVGWYEYTEFEIATVQLQAGKNVIKIGIGYDAWINMDYIKLISTGSLSATAFE